MTYNGDINLDEYNLIPNLNNSPDFLIFADEISPLIKETLELPYGCLAILVYAMKDMIKGQEFEVPKYLYPTMMKAYFLMSGAILANKNINLTITKEDIQKMNRITKILVGLICLIEMYYRREIDVVLKDGYWYVKDGDRLIEEAKKYPEKLFQQPK